MPSPIALTTFLPVLRQDSIARGVCKARRRWLSLLIVLSLGLLLSGCATRAPDLPLSVFLTPPYASVVNGGLPAVTNECVEVPRLHAGQVVAFFGRADGGVQAMVCEKEVRVAVDPAMADKATEGVAVGSGQIATRATASRIESVASGGGIATSATASQLESVASGGGLESRQKDVAVDLSSGQGGVASVSRDTMLDRRTSAASVSVAEDSSLVTAKKEDGSLASVSGGGQFGQDKQGGEMDTRTGTQQMSGMEAGAGNLSTSTKTVATPEAVVLKSDTALVKTRQERDVTGIESVADMQGTSASANVTGKTLNTELALVAQKDESGLGKQQSLGELRHVEDVGGLAVLFDSALLSLLEEEGELSGFYGADNVIVEADELTIGPDERSSFVIAFNGRQSLSNLLNREVSAAFREEGRQLTNATYKGVMSVATINGVRTHHGQKMAWTVSVKNEGSAPLYDVLLLAAVPEHARFDRTVAASRGARGYVDQFFPENNFVMWKLYRPVRPGETFKATYLIKLDKWDVFEMAAKLKNGEKGN